MTGLLSGVLFMWSFRQFRKWLLFHFACKQHLIKKDDTRDKSAQVQSRGASLYSPKRKIIHDRNMELMHYMKTIYRVPQSLRLVITVTQQKGNFAQDSHSKWRMSHEIFSRKLEEWQIAWWEMIAPSAAPARCSTPTESSLQSSTSRVASPPGRRLSGEWRPLDTRRQARPRCVSAPTATQDPGRGHSTAGVGLPCR